MSAIPIPEILRQLAGTILHESDDHSPEELVSDVTWFSAEAQDWLAEKAFDTNPDPLPEFRLLADAVAHSLRNRVPLETLNEALEVVRRTERALALSIKAGQDAGVISSRLAPLLPTGPKREYTRGDGTLVQAAALVVKARAMRSVNDFYPRSQGKGGGSVGQDGRRFAELDNTAFDKVLAAARAEPGLLTRVKVLRLVNQEKPHEYSDMFAAVTELAQQGSTSSQVAQALNVSEEYVRRYAKEHSIPIPGDDVRGRGRKVIDPMRIVRETAIGLEGTVSALDLLDLSALDSGNPELAQWAASIQRSLRSISKMNKNLKEIVND